MSDSEIYRLSDAQAELELADVIDQFARGLRQLRNGEEVKSWQ